MDQDAQGSFTFLTNNYPVKTQTTEYAYFCFSKSDIVGQGVPDAEINVIGFQALISEESSRHVHHFVLYGAPEEEGPCLGIGQKRGTVVYGKNMRVSEDGLSRAAWFW